MNILIYHGSGRYSFRPDTSLNKECQDYYCPDGVAAIRGTICAYTRIIKAGKAVGEAFAGRYFNSCGFALLLDDATPWTAPEVASSMDNTTFITPEIPLSESVCARAAVEEASAVSAQIAATDLFREAVCSISRKVSLRIGDLLIIPAAEAFLVKKDCKVNFMSGEESYPFKIFFAAD